MKIRTITCHHAYNHGAMLQAYALTKYLQSLGHDASIINYRPGYKGNYNYLWYQSERARKYWLGIPYVLYHLPRRLLNVRKIKAFNSFVNKWLTIDNHLYTDIEQLRNAPPIADLYIAGSDQIWNTTLRTDAAFYLDFGTPKRKISYAASFATPKLKVGTEAFVRDKLRNFDAISVRETSALDILKSLGYKGEVVVDPVLLLSSEEWKQMMIPLKHDKYILVYDFYGQKDIKQIAQRLARLKGCKVYSVSPNYLSYAHRNYNLSAPQYFLSLVNGAECVISNSFHGTVFSLIFETDFFVIGRCDGMNERMKDLLRRYKLSNRLVTSDVTDKELCHAIDYTTLKGIIDNDIKYSKLFMSEQLRISSQR